MNEALEKGTCCSIREEDLAKETAMRDEVIETYGIRIVNPKPSGTGQRLENVTSNKNKNGRMFPFWGRREGNTTI